MFAAALAKPSNLGLPLAYSSAPLLTPHLPLGAPLAYSAIAAPLAAAPVIAAPAPLALPAPIARVAVAPAPVAIPAPVTYNTGVEVSVAAEPVEQHGYKIVY